MMPVHQYPESDCKASPLALLVQICSNIGAEKPTNKSSDKNANSGSNNSNSSSSNSSSDEIRVTKDSKDVLSCSPATSVHSASSLTSSTNRTSREDTFAGSSNSKRNTPSECRSSPLLGRSSVERRTTPRSAVHSPDGHHRPKSRGDKTPTSSASSAATSSHDTHTSTTSSSTGASSSASDPTYSSSSSIGLDFSRDSGSLLSGKDGASANSLGGLGSYKAGLNGLNPLALANCSGCSPVAGHIPLDATATYPLAGALKGGYSFGSALSPYMNYARMKSAAAGGASTLVPVCRDPYCTNCQLAAQLPYQDRLAAHMSSLYQGGYPGYPVPGFSNPGTSAFASSVLPRPPNVCNWMLGDSCCNKRFTSSEELFQHLRTHTTLPGSGTLPLYSPGVSLPSALAMEACGLYTTPSLTTPAGLRRTYPTSLSPVSSLSAAGRYHPYKAPGLSPLSSAPLPPLGHPGLGFYNPYSGVYGKG